MRKFCLSLILFILWSSPAIYAQGARLEAPPVRLGKLDTAHVTCEALLKNVKLVAQDPHWVVTRFRITFTLPDGKTYGPFSASGAELPEAAIKAIKKLKKEKADITIDDINVAYNNGKEKFTLPVNLRYNN